MSKCEYKYATGYNDPWYSYFRYRTYSRQKVKEETRETIIDDLFYDPFEGEEYKPFYDFIDYTNK